MRQLDALDIARFWLQAEKRDCGYRSLCWVWTGTCWSNEYAQFKVDGQNLLGHRVAWSLVYGDPGELFVCHRCDIHPCVRPTHLFLGDDVANLNDMARKGRAAVHRTEIPPEMRERIVAAGLSGHWTQLEVAKRFGITQSAVSQILSKHRATIKRPSIRKRKG